MATNHTCYVTAIPDGMKVRGDLATYVKFKVTPSGWLNGYWNAGRSTRSGFYRDVLVFLGPKYVGATIEKMDARTLKIYPKE